MAADDDDHNVDAHSGDQNLALSDQFLKEKIEIGDWRFTLNSVKVRVHNILHILCSTTYM